MRAAVVRVSLSELERQLCLDKIGVKITRVRQTWEHENAQMMELMIEGDDLFEVLPGHPIPEVLLEMTSGSHLVSTKIIK